MRPRIAPLTLVFALFAAASARAQAQDPVGWGWPPNAANVADGEACTEELTELGVGWQPGEREPRIATPVVVPGLKFRGLQLVSRFREPPFVMDCHLALALATHAADFVAAGITELHFTSMHDYRVVQSSGRLSRHAYGLAIDVFSVRTAEGTVLEIEQDYAHPQLGELAFLLAGELEAFRGVFTPANDATGHGDHIHLDARRGPATRQIAADRAAARQKARRAARQKRAGKARQRKARARKARARKARARKARQRKARQRKARQRKARQRKARQRKARARKAKARHAAARTADRAP